MKIKSLKCLNINAYSKNAFKIKDEKVVLILRSNFCRHTYYDPANKAFMSFTLYLT